MTKAHTIKTAWGSKQVEVPGLPELTRDEEVTLRQEWCTPQNFCRVIDEEFKFDIDVAASADNAVCRDYAEAELDD